MIYESAVEYFTTGWIINFSKGKTLFTPIMVVVVIVLVIMKPRISNVGEMRSRFTFTHMNSDRTARDGVYHVMNLALPVCLPLSSTLPILTASQSRLETISCLLRLSFDGQLNLCHGANLVTFFKVLGYRDLNAPAESTRSAHF